jgi:hypothetical protein
VPKYDRNIGLQEKRQLFAENWEKIAENCDHNIDPGPKTCFTRRDVFGDFFSASQTNMNRQQKKWGADLHLKQAIGPFL